MGTSCPDHFLRTRICPMFVPWKPEREDVAALQQRIAERVGRYRDDYVAYYKSFAEPARRRCATRIRRWSSFPALGLFGFGKDKREARITTEFFVNAIHVMAGANAPRDAGWTHAGARRLPQARRPSRRISSRASTTTSRCRGARRSASSTGRSKKRSCSGCRRSASSAGKIALVVGGGSGIGREVALQLARRGAHVVVADRNAAGAEATWRAKRGKLSTPEMGDGRRARSVVARQHRRGAARDRPGVRRRRHRRQHGGDLSDAGPVDRRAEDGVGEDAAHQRDRQLRAGGGSGARC